MYELNLDSDTFSTDEAFVYVNYRSVANAANGRPLVVAGAGLDLSDMAMLIEDFRLGDDGRASLLSAEGEMLVHSGETISSVDVAKALPPQAAQRLQRDEQLKVDEIERNGQTLLISTRWIPELQRYLMVEVNKEAYLASTRERFLASSGIGLLILLAGLLVLYPLTGRLIRPLIDFQGQLKDITHSLDLSRRVSTDDKAGRFSGSNQRTA